MSGFAAIVSLDGAPFDPGDISRMAPHVARHGRGEARTQPIGSAALAFAPLETLDAPAAHDVLVHRQDGSWILGDIRVDARASLLEALKAADRPAAADTSDAKLVLHAYDALGENMLDRLIGDFSFALWDATRKTLFCARDHFGIKPLYFSRSGNTVVLANDISALRRHPAVSDRLHEPAIADFLAYGINLDEGATTFADVRRLPPGHAVRFARNAPSEPRSYRRLWPEETLRLRDPADYRDRFLELFRSAVSDRLRIDRVGFELSGGMDSTSIAAMAMQLGGGIPGFRGMGITTDYSHRAPEDEEARYAAEAAEYIGCEHRLMPAAPDEDIFQYNATAEPGAWAFAATLNRYADTMRRYSRVMLSGHGGDPFTMGSGFYVLDRFRTASFPAFLAEILRLARQRKTLRGLGLTSLWKPDLPRIARPRLPAWLRADFARRAGVAERWEQLFYRPGRYPAGCTAELAWDEAHMPSWTHIFERYYHDAFAGIDCRQPLFDLRLVRFLLAIPPDIKQDKKILRDATLGLLPESVRKREKSIAHADVFQSALARSNVLERMDLELDALGEWVDTGLYRQSLLDYAAGQTGDRFTMACPINLDLWLKAQIG